MGYAANVPTLPAGIRVARQKLPIFGTSGAVVVVSATCIFSDVPVLFWSCILKRAYCLVERVRDAVATVCAAVVPPTICPMSIVAVPGGATIPVTGDIQ